VKTCVKAFYDPCIPRATDSNGYVTRNRSRTLIAHIEAHCAQVTDKSIPNGVGRSGLIPGVHRRNSLFRSQAPDDYRHVVFTTISSQTGAKREPRP
jgi:hypothetical protein